MKSKVAAIFDFDGTLITGDSFVFFLFYTYFLSLGNLKYIPYLLATFVKRRANKISHAQLKERCLVALNSKQRQYIEHLGLKCFEKFLTSRINNEAERRLLQHIRENHEIIIATGTLDFLVSPIAIKFGIHNIICTQLKYDSEGKFAGKLNNNPPLGKEKQEAVEKTLAQMDIRLDDCYFYTDHESDFCLLTRVGKPIVVSPTKELMALAVRQNWPIIL